MFNTIKVTYCSEDFLEVYLFVEKHIHEWVDIKIEEDKCTITFTCWKWNKKKVLRKLKNARFIGYENKVMVK